MVDNLGRLQQGRKSRDYVIQVLLGLGQLSQWFSCGVAEYHLAEWWDG